MSVHDENDTHFINLFAKHPNLYNDQHHFHRDPVMTKGSWGQIAIAMGITAKQAEEKWQQLLNFYYEETALRRCEDAGDIQVAAADESPYDFLYDKIKLLLQPQDPAIFCKKKQICKVSVKNRWAKTTKKATDASKHLKQKLENFSSTSQLSSNAKIGKLIEAELMRKSPRTRALKRQELMRRVLQHLENYDN